MQVGDILEDGSRVVSVAPGHCWSYIKRGRYWVAEATHTHTVVITEPTGQAVLSGLLDHLRQSQPSQASRYAVPPKR